MIAQHICIGDTRWDTIAQLAYGDSFRVSEIFDANPNLQIHAVVPAGTVVNVPIIEVVAADVVGLPPWKQSQSTEGVETAKAAVDVLAALFNNTTKSGGSFDGSFD
jgi:hypothetical protein